MARIKYPEPWPPKDRDELDAMFDKARAEKKWFFARYQGMWFTPDELQAQQEKGRLIWSASNWTLRSPAEALNEASQKLNAAQAEFDATLAKVKPIRGTLG